MRLHCHKGLSTALVGDVFLTGPISSAADADVLSARNELRQCDVAFANLETLFHDFESPPMAESGGTYARSAPALIQELSWLGLSMLSAANNHAGDYGGGGLLTSLENLHDNGVIVAGAGRDLTAARRPAIVHHERGRVALIAATATFPRHIRATDDHGVSKPRPGISPLRYHLVFKVSAEQFDSLQTITRLLGLKPQACGERRSQLFRTYRLMEGYRFEIGDPVGSATRAYEPDLLALVDGVSEARARADLVIVSLHVHENLDGRPQMPPRFLREAARTLIDAGADAVVGHGPHVLRGIELYRGRPIFYSLGNFVFQTHAATDQPPDAYEAYGLRPDAGPEALRRAREQAGHTLRNRAECWRSMIVQIRWIGRAPRSIRIVPVELARSGAATGVPRRARRLAAQATLHELAALSADFGTMMTIHDDAAFVSL
jgi:poly-gamma-glutamate capsule biosynthesis protein CapA/YwtB (metallophosphatase superfamily)